MKPLAVLLTVFAVFGQVLGQLSVPEGKYVVVGSALDVRLADGSFELGRFQYGRPYNTIQSQYWYTFLEHEGKVIYPVIGVIGYTPKSGDTLGMKAGKFYHSKTREYAASLRMEDATFAENKYSLDSILLYGGKETLKGSVEGNCFAGTYEWRLGHLVHIKYANIEMDSLKFVTRTNLEIYEGGKKVGYFNPTIIKEFDTLEIKTTGIFHETRKIGYVYTPLSDINDFLNPTFVRYSKMQNYKTVSRTGLFTIDGKKLTGVVPKVSVEGNRLNIRIK